MKKIAIALSVLFLLAMPFTVGCGSTGTGSKKPEILRVYNCEDYIAIDDEETADVNESTLDGFVKYMKDKGRNVAVEYSTFGTLENMYNELKINPGSYDLVCPSEYMIQKMMHEKMLEPFSDDFKNQTGEFKNNNYFTYASPFIQNMFENSTIEIGGKATPWSDYAVCYMWGTMGLLYNPDRVNRADMESWSSLWDAKYKNLSTVKDSIRDTYFLGVAKTFENELMGYANDYASGKLNLVEYGEKLTEVVNRNDADTVALVEKNLSSLKSNVYGFEVDSGKNDMVTGKIAINFAWSGDAVYSMDEAENSGLSLEYSVPKEGSNVWFDGWVMPKGANTELAEQFINYISMPETAINNMEYIGYTSPIAGQEVLDWLADYYELSFVSEGENTEACDLSYFFNGTIDEDSSAIFYASELLRQFSTQYPTEDVTARLAVMSFFDAETNTRLNEMWARVKGSTMPLWLIILSVIIIVGIMAAILVYRFRHRIFKHEYSTIEKPLKNGLKVIMKEEIQYYKEEEKNKK